jgi:alanine dehydrogenase
MRIAVPNEVQDNENRVGMTPDGARRLVEAGHEVRVETHAGSGAGFPDDDYREAGAEIAPDAETAWGEGELVV